MLDLLIETVRSIRAHALRFLLTSLGITWGAFMLTYSTASMQGLDDHFRREMENSGQRIVYLFPGTVIKNRVGERGAREVDLRDDDVARLASYASLDEAVPNLLMWNQIVRGEGRTKLLSVYGVAPESLSIRNFAVAEGRFVTEADLAEGARVAFLGAESARRLFGRAPAVGKTVRIEGQPFRVCGVAVQKGQQLVGFGGRDDRAVLVPYTAAQRWLTRSQTIHQAVFTPVTRQRSYEAIARVRESLGLHHAFDPGLETALSFINVHDILLILDGLFFGLRIFMLAAALITLLVGAIGVMNIMLVVVAERTREIGLRKAVGASRAAIFTAFLAEATTVCLLSGILGASLGAGLAFLVAQQTDPAKRVISPPQVDPTTVVTLVAALVAIGIVAGVVPALRAARVPPAEALRSQ